MYFSNSSPVHALFRKLESDFNSLEGTRHRKSGVEFSASNILSTGRKRQVLGLKVSSGILHLWV